MLAHSLSMINVQSSVALELLDEHPERPGLRLRPSRTPADRRFRMHLLVTALRADGAEPTAPTPGIADLDGLVGAACATGLTVSTARWANHGHCPR